MRLWAPAIPEDALVRRTTAAPSATRRVLVCAMLLLSAGAVAGCANGVATIAAPQSTPAAPVAAALGPQLGYLWLAADQSLRPILGIPGASQIGQSVVPAGLYVNATASATAELALLQSADGSFYRMALPSGPSIPLSFTLPVGASIRLSPGATAGIAFNPGSTSASLITGLPTSPRVQTVSAAAGIADAAVSDAGSVAFESGHVLSVVALNGTLNTIATIGAPGGVSFLPGSRTSHDDLLFADFAANSVTLFRSSSNGGSAQTVSTSGDLNAPSSVGVSASGRWALIANSGSKSAVRLDLLTLTASSVACVCQPTLAEPLADDGAFRVTALASGPNWLVNAAPTTPVTLFIPALPAPANLSALASLARP